jgi:hypothetical protein
MWAGGAAALSPIRACASSFMDVFSRVFEHGNKLGVFRLVSLLSGPQGAAAEPRLLPVSTFMCFQLTLAVA